MPITREEFDKISKEKAILSPMIQFLYEHPNVAYSLNELINLDMDVDFNKLSLLIKLKYIESARVRSGVYIMLSELGRKNVKVKK